MTKRVAVVGSGIAGPAAVLALTRAGVVTHWIAPEPDADHDPVGETLSPAANPILSRLGLDDIVQVGAHRPSNVTLSSWGSDRLIDRNAILHLEGPGLVLDRRRFETDLRAAALSAGAQSFVTKLAATEVRNGVWRLTLEDGGAVEADAVIDASGRAAVVARDLSERRRADQLIAAHAFLHQRADDVEPTPAVLIEAVRSGWWYAALRPDGSLSVAYFTDPDLLGETPTRALDIWRRLIGETRYIGRWIDDADFAADAPPRLSSAGTTWLDRPAGTVDGAPWLAIGDCAAAFDPLSSHGMTTALWAGERSATVIVDALDGDDADMILGDYATAVTDGVSRFLGQRRDMYALERRFAEAPFWTRRRLA